MSRSNLKPVSGQTKDIIADVADSAHQAVDRVSTELEPTYEQLKEQVEALKSDLATLASTARKAGNEAVNVAKAKVAEAQKSVPAAVDRASEVLNDQLTAMLETTEKFVRERPTTAIGLAVGAGFLLALMTSPRTVRK